MSAHSNITTEIISKNGVTILKYLHFTLSVTTIQKMPKTKMPMCFITGAR